MKNQHGFIGLIALLITVAIIAVISVKSLKSYTSKDTVKDDTGQTTSYQGAIQSAQDARSAAEQSERARAQ